MGEGFMGGIVRSGEFEAKEEIKFGRERREERRGKAVLLIGLFLRFGFG